MTTPARDRCLCVSGLPCTTDDAELRRLFQVFGPLVSTQVLREAHGGQRRGIVTFRDPESANKAIATMKGFHHRGASIHVQLAGFVNGTAPAPDENTRVKPTREERRQLYDARLTGYLLTWKGQYGWIEADTRIKHPTAAKHDGRVFVDVQDIDGDVQLGVGDRVSFLAYVDSDGIGASDVRLEQSRATRVPSSSSSSAPAPVGTCDTEVYVDGWPPNLEKSAFVQTFEVFGYVRSASVYPPRVAGERASGCVVFASRVSALNAVETMHGRPYGTGNLHVAFASLDDVAPGSEPPLAQSSKPVPGLADATQGQAKTAVADASPGDSRVLGTAKSWKGRFGWIIPDRHIPASPGMKHKGWVYAEAKDIENASELRLGDRVSFVVYRDSKGIGASKVRVERDGNSFSLSAPAGGSDAQEVASAATQRPTKWWHDLAGDCCPISLTPLEELPYEPFGLLGSTEGAEERSFEGLWGSQAVAAFFSMKPVHWFDGKFLACSMVSKGQLVDPVSMRPLAREECASLDRYLQANGLPAVHVEDAFRCASAGLCDMEESKAKERLLALGRDAASMLRIFDEEPDSGSGWLEAASSGLGAVSGSGQASPTATTEGGTGRRRRWGPGK